MLGVLTRCSLPTGNTGRQSGRKERTSDLPVAQSIRRSRRLNRDTTVQDQETLAPADQSSQAAPALEDNEYYLTSEWPPKVLDHLAAIFSDGFYIGEVLKVLDDETAGYRIWHQRKF